MILSALANAAGTTLSQLVSDYFTGLVEDDLWQ
jgi:hypothetical protein